MPPALSRKVPLLARLMRCLRRRLKGQNGSNNFVPLSQQLPNHKIGKWTYGFAPRILSFEDQTKLEIGSFCSISAEVTILLGGEHRADWVTTYPFSALWPSASDFKGHPKSKGNILIGHDVWIGYGATILSGVSIGTGAVVGCGAVVTRNVPPYGIVAGNPARLIRYRFPEAQIERLLESKWWDLPDPDLTRLFPLLLSDRIEEFLARVSAPCIDRNHACIQLLQK